MAFRPSGFDCCIISAHFAAASGRVLLLAVSAAVATTTRTSGSDIAKNPREIVLFPS